MDGRFTELPTKATLWPDAAPRNGNLAMIASAYAGLGPNRAWKASFNPDNFEATLQLAKPTD